MIFSPQMITKIESGQKTQTRRLVKPGDDTILDKSGNIIAVIAITGKGKGYRLRREVGKSYAIQPGRGASALFRFFLHAIRTERVGDISEDDARAEGFSSRDEFLDYWRRLHKHNASLDQQVWVLDFSIHGPRGCALESCVSE